MLKGMIKARQFHGIEPLGKLIDQQQNEESSAALRKMQYDYDIANQKLTDVYRIERTAIEGKGERRISDVVRLRDRELKILTTRVETLNRTKESAVANQKKIFGWDLFQKGGTSQSSLGTRPTVPGIPAFVRNPRLSVPAFAPKKRNIPASRPATASICRPVARPSSSS
jgi:hypothetical protein